MNQNFEQYFPADFLTDYILQNETGLQRLQTYSIFRFLTAAENSGFLSIAAFQKDLNYMLSEESFAVIEDYLSKDLYFSPSFRENSYDAILLYDAIIMVDSEDSNGFSKVKQIFSLACPKILQINFSSLTEEFSILPEQELEFFGALSLLTYENPSFFTKQISKFAHGYCESLHFTYEDFLLYSFMDEYFETKNCLSNPKYQELIHTLVIATLKAHDTDLEKCVKEIISRQLSHPHSKFAGIYRYGAMDFVASSDFAKECNMFRHLLDYAVTYELRNNLFDFHLEEERLITLDNWKEKLKWYHIQYDNAYELAISSFYTAYLSKKLLKSQFEKNLSLFR